MKATYKRRPNNPKWSPTGVNISKEKGKFDELSGADKLSRASVEGLADFRLQTFETGSNNKQKIKQGSLISVPDLKVLNGGKDDSADGI